LAVRRLRDQNERGGRTVKMAASLRIFYGNILVEELEAADLINLDKIDDELVDAIKHFAKNFRRSRSGIERHFEGKQA
jgi:hypothetical protein